MKFSTSKTELQQALQKLSKATPTRSTLPILGCVLIESSEEKTTLRATDLEITIQEEISVSLEQAGSTALPLKTLFDITNELPETRLTLMVDEKDRASIITDNGEYDLMAKPADEFPAVPDTSGSKSVGVSGEMLKNIIDATSFARSEEHTSELQSQAYLVCRLLLEKKKNTPTTPPPPPTTPPPPLDNIPS